MTLRALSQVSSGRSILLYVLDGGFGSFEGLVKSVQDNGVFDGPDSQV